MKHIFLLVPALLLLAACSKEATTAEPRIAPPKDTTGVVVPAYPRTEVYDGIYTQFEEHYSFEKKINRFCDTSYPATAVVTHTSDQTLQVNMRIRTIFPDRPASYQSTEPSHHTFEQAARLESGGLFYRFISPGYRSASALFPGSSDSLILNDEYHSKFSIQISNQFRGKKRP